MYDSPWTFLHGNSTLMCRDDQRSCGRKGACTERVGATPAPVTSAKSSTSWCRVAMRVLPSFLSSSELADHRSSISHASQPLFVRGQRSEVRLPLLPSSPFTSSLRPLQASPLDRPKAPSSRPALGTCPVSPCHSTARKPLFRIFSSPNVPAPVLARPKRFHRVPRRARGLQAALRPVQYRPTRSPLR